jgi:hypothetical protein
MENGFECLCPPQWAGKTCQIGKPGKERWRGVCSLSFTLENSEGTVSAWETGAKHVQKAKDEYYVLGSIT